MKNIDYYLKLPYRLEIVPDIYEGGYVASYPELPGCLTCAETIEEVIASALDAKKGLACCIGRWRYYTRT